ncbi:glycosyltransferase [Agrococcus sp. KRD186]|uniref:glycosyltransferase n=1 Tax=Agrococcus sp. KRD186 TaxID=2729730 RepID=UPI0019D0DC71|nr:glycosyltransferase [Agrococcus sp. KRD186]
MRVLLLTHYFEPENGPSQRRWSALIERFVAAGHIVDVVAPPPHNRTGKIDPDAPAAALRGRTAVGSHGGTVHRVSFLQHTGGVASRTLDHLWVARGSVRAVRRLVRDGRLNPDIVVATAPALPSLIAGRTVARMLHIPLVVEMRDAWPDLVSHTPGLTRGKRVVTRLKRRVHEFVTALQRSAALVVTTTETFARVLRERDVATVAVIRNGTSLRRYAGIPPTEHGHDELRVLYMGTIGALLTYLWAR